MSQRSTSLGSPHSKARAGNLPSLETALTEVPSPTSRLGVHSGGEGGTIPVLAAMINAAVDALAEVGVRTSNCLLPPSGCGARSRRQAKHDLAVPQVFARGAQMPDRGCQARQAVEGCPLHQRAHGTSHTVHCCRAWCRHRSIHAAHLCGAGANFNRIAGEIALKSPARDAAKRSHI